MHRRTFGFSRPLALAFTIGAAIASAQTNQVTVTSAASYAPIVAAGSIVSAWGSGFTANTVAANTSSSNGQLITLPNTLGNVTVTVTDKGNTSSTQSLYLVSPGQINLALSPNAALGPATISIQRSGASALTGTLQISNVAPAIYTADTSGMGVPVGSVLRVNTAQVISVDNIFQSGTSTYTPKPFSVGGPDTVYLVLYGTGIRNRSLNPVKATIGNTVVPVAYAGPQPTYPGFDQVNVGPLPATLAGSGNANLTLFVDGVPSNAVQVSVQ